MISVRLNRGRYIDVPRGAAHESAFPLLGRLRLQNCGGRPLLPPPIRGRVVLLLLVVVLSGGGKGHFIFGRHSEAPLRRGPPLAPLAFFLAFFFGGL